MATPHPGKWKPVFETTTPDVPPKVVLDTEQIASHACVFCTNLQTQTWKVLYGYPTFPEPPVTGKIRTRVWNPNDPGEAPTAQEIPSWPGVSHDPPRLFCGGHVFMSNGKLLWAGGIRFPVGNEPTQAPHPPNDNGGIFGLNYTYIFNPNPPSPGQEWEIAGGESNPHAMSQDRFYPTLTQLGVTPPGFNGKVVAMSGFISWTHQIVYALIPEIYDETSGWYPLPNASQPFHGNYGGNFDYYPSAHLIPSGPRAGHIFYSIPMEQAFSFNPFGGGISNPYWTAIGEIRTNRYRLNGTSTMLPILPPYDSAKVLIIGGATAYGGGSFNSAEIIDIATADAATPWTALNNFLFFARKNHISVILPNDMLFIVGGNVKSFASNTDPVLTAELVDTSNPSLGTTMLPAHVYPRGHHSVAALLPDATVWVAGQGELSESGVPLINQKNIEIYEPGYLFDMADRTIDRPVINSAPPTITYGVDFIIQTSHEIAAIRLISLGAITHSTEMNQRSVGLNYDGSPSNYKVYLQQVNPNIAPPGLYMLFVLRPKIASKSGETMIPSVAKIVMLS